jgi:hypothetical protein
MSFDFSKFANRSGSTSSKKEWNLNEICLGLILAQMVDSTKGSRQNALDEIAAVTGHPVQSCGYKFFGPAFIRTKGKLTRYGISHNWFKDAAAFERKEALDNHTALCAIYAKCGVNMKNKSLAYIEADMQWRATSAMYKAGRVGEQDVRDALAARDEIDNEVVKATEQTEICEVEVVEPETAEVVEENS